jgi:hypothetical protein
VVEAVLGMMAIQINAIRDYFATPAPNHQPCQESRISQWF